MRRNCPTFQKMMIQLAIDADLQEYTARRMGEESGSVVVLDCLTGDILTMVSMPAYDPNSFSDGIGRAEWKMLSEDPRQPLRNKVLNSLYPPGSTIKPMGALALLQHGVDPKERIHCPGGYRLGNRFFRCLGRHGSVDMRRAIAKSCNTYFYAMGHRIGYDRMFLFSDRTGNTVTEKTRKQFAMELQSGLLRVIEDYCMGWPPGALHLERAATPNPAQTLRLLSRLVFVQGSRADTAEGV